MTNSVEMNTWPFDDPPNRLSLTTRQIWYDGEDVLEIYHDSDDGIYQFMSGKSGVVVEDGILICLEDMMQMDNSLYYASTIPLGWMALRNSVDDEWQMRERPADIDHIASP